MVIDSLFGLNKNTALAAHTGKYTTVHKCLERHFLT